METGTVIALFREAVIYTMLIASPVLIIGAAVGLILSVFQATTSLQDQTLTFVPKIFAIFGALAYFGPWMLNLLVSYTNNLFAQISGIT
jgi:flagellar biosynthetic protein FliQ